MAQSPAHRFGQIIGDVLEEAVVPLLRKFAREHGLYLDMKGPRPCRKGKKCSWKDLNGNLHDLDFVLERGGTPDRRGIPAAFIETAWRRYTKHSRNKAQEIQGAIGPLMETYRNAGPFTGVILAGVFTDGAITQLRSLGFTVLYFPYETIISVFKNLRINAAFDEDTPDEEVQKKVAKYESLSPAKRLELARKLIKANARDVRSFMSSLTAVVSRQIERIIILPLRGQPYEMKTLAEAIRFVETYDESTPSNTMERYEIRIRYNNGNVIEGKFNEKAGALDFLRSYLPELAR